MKYVILTVITLIVCFVPAWFLSGLIKRKKPLNTVKRLLLTFLAGILLFTAAGIGYLEIYYHAEDSARSALTTSNGITVSKLDEGWFFDGPASDKALVFYPGGKVEETAYAPLMKKLASAGIDCFLVKMPFRMAVLGSNKADSLIKKYSYDKWYLAGHSLGGSSAALYGVKHEDKLDGLILLASYPTKKLNELPLLSIYGSLDGCLEMDQYSKNKKNWPDDSLEMIINGGNHCQFGNYGHQKGDGIAEMTADNQQDETVKIIINWISGN